MKLNGSNDEGGSQYGGGYYYGEGDYAYGGYGPSRSHRGPTEYIAMLRERIWWLIIALFVVVIVVGMYTINATPLYTASMRLQVMREQARATEFNEVMDTRVANDADFNTEVQLLESMTVISAAAARLRDSERRALVAPYKDSERSSPEYIIYKGRNIQPLRQTLMVDVRFTHPDPEVAARICNYIGEEYINFKHRKRNEASMQAVDELQAQIAVQGQKVRDLELRMADLKEKHNAISFDATTDIDQQELLRLNQYATDDKRVLDEARALWQLVEQAQEQGRDLWEIPVIAQNEQIPPILQRRTEEKIEIARLSQKYRAKHPLMVQAKEALQQTNRELEAAVASVARGLYNNLLHAQANYDNSQARIAQKERDRIMLERLRPEYEQLKRDLDGARKHYDYLYSRNQETLALSTDEGRTARIVDPAVPPLEPSSPRIVLNMVLAVLGGTGLGLGIIFLFALLDDKVKSAFDIENSVGLPIIGVIPRIGKSQPQERARAASGGSERQTVEAFRSIHSSLKLNEDSRNAKVILTTSTIPSEGKSFITTNLALTYAAHGERVIVVDGDLRMPNVAKSLGMENNQGILQVIDGKAPLEDVIIRDVEDNFDVLSTGGSTKNPTQILSSDRFEELIHELRLRYDRVFIDSPPLAPVSDALTVLPLVDGVVYVIRFNTVKRKTANLNVRRLRESDVPVFGAVLNNIAGGVAGYYYSHYYNKSYSKYYEGEDDTRRALKPRKDRRARSGADEPKPKVEA